VKAVAAITRVTDAVLGMLRLAAYLRDPFRGMRRFRKPTTARIAMYQIPAAGDVTDKHLPQGADPRAWSWRAAKPHRVS
jgi:hypothetical protein